MNLDYSIRAAEDILQNCMFLDKEDTHFMDAAKSFFLYAYEKTNNPRYLIKICNLLVKKNKRTTPEVLEYAKKALIQGQHPDAVVYFCKSLVINADFEVALKEIEEIKKISWRDEKAKSLIDIFEGCAHYKSGNYQQYINKIKNFNINKNPDFNPYISIPASTVYTDLMVKNKDISNSIIGDLKTSTPPYKPDYIISVSCDKKYFDTYSKYFIESLKKIDDNFYCHISVTDSVDYVTDDYRFSVVSQNINTTNNLGPISSCLRFIHASDLINNRNCPVLVLDFDCIFKKSPKILINSAKNHDCGMRELINVLPWEIYTGGMSIYNQNDKSIRLLKNMKQYFFETINDDSVQWWIDQNAIEAAVRTELLSDGITIKNIHKDIPAFMHIPTGSRESKIKQLDQFI